MQRPDSKHWSTGALLSGGICKRYGWPYLLFICDFIVILSFTPTIAKSLSSITHSNSLSLAPKPMLIPRKILEGIIHKLNQKLLCPIPVCFLLTQEYIASVLSPSWLYASITVSAKKAFYWGQDLHQHTDYFYIYLSFLILWSQQG